MKPKSARLGMVWRMLATASTGRFKLVLRVSSMPTGMPTATATSVETATSRRCSAVSARISRQLRSMNSNAFIPSPRAGRNFPRRLPRLAVGARVRLFGADEGFGRVEREEAAGAHQRDARAS